MVRARASFIIDSSFMNGKTLLRMSLVCQTWNSSYLWSFESRDHETVAIFIEHLSLVSHVSFPRFFLRCMACPSLSLSLSLSMIENRIDSGSSQPVDRLEVSENQRTLEFCREDEELDDPRDSHRYSPALLVIHHSSHVSYNFSINYFFKSLSFS